MTASPIRGDMPEENPSIRLIQKLFQVNMEWSGVRAKANTHVSTGKVLAIFFSRFYLSTFSMNELPLMLLTTVSCWRNQEVVFPCDNAWLHTTNQPCRKLKQIHRTIYFKNEIVLPEVSG
ncbi:hypothetical protein ACJJTC_004733 [Scirpophaga incertulas]